MYSFELTDYQKEIRDRARRFAQEELLKDVLDRDRTEKYDMNLIKKLGDMGLIGLQFDKKYGGHGDDYLAFLLVVEELSKVDSVFLMLFHQHLQQVLIPLEMKSKKCIVCQGYFQVMR